jgi:enoyl-[acyl-carrier protein] reductase I
MSGLLDGKTALVMGARNKWSIAWAIAETFAREGARLALTYQGEREQSDVTELGKAIGGALVAPCDVTDPEQTTALFDRIKSEFGRLDVLVHSVAYAKREELSGRFADTSKDGFLLSQEISVYSFVEAARLAEALMPAGGSMMTLTYIGAERAIPNYNVMGVAKAALEAGVRYLAADLGPRDIRVNAISAGPLKTLSARGISDFSEVLRMVEERSCMRRNITQDEVADVALFLASRLSRAVTGEVIHVDAGYHIAGA